MNQWIAIGLGGALGAILRHLIGVWMQMRWGNGFPWGTLVVNLLGCFVIGLLYQLFTTVPISASWRLFIFTGLLGALTTFSTYGLNTIQLIQRGKMETAVLNILANNLLGIGLLFLGIYAVKLLLNK
jgi:CrcB protein